MNRNNVLKAKNDVEVFLQNNGVQNIYA